MELKSVSDWEELLVRKHKVQENLLMELDREYADTPQKKEAIRLALEASHAERRRIERSIEARAARSDPRVGRDRNDGRNAGRLPR